MQDQLYVNQSGIIYLRRNGEDIEISDQEQAKDLVWQFHKAFYKVPPGIYPIPDLKWEVKELFYCRKCGTENCTACEGERTIYRRKKAILTLSEQPKGELFKDLTPEMSERLTKHIKFEPQGEESQEELMQEIFDLCQQDEWHKALSKFTITRNLKSKISR